ncbi:2-methylcitrate dehydratase, partial [mine drainage metagenome]
MSLTRHEDRPDSGQISAQDRLSDPVLEVITDYVFSDKLPSALAYETAWLSLMDSIGVALRSLAHRSCTRLLGPWIPGGTVAHGARVPGTHFELDPIKAAFDTGALIRWLDYNDTWLAAEWAHPSDNLGALLAVADYLNQRAGAPSEVAVTIEQLLRAMIRAYEIQGILALTNSLNAVGVDHVVYVRVASAALATRLLGGSRAQVLSAVTGAFADGGTLRVYRHFPNTGTRKSWAAADATARGVQLALMSVKGEMGYPEVLTTPRWGFNDVVLKGAHLALARPLGSYV